MNVINVHEERARRRQRQKIDPDDDLETESVDDYYDPDDDDDSSDCVCRYCGKELSSKYNRKRHENSIHSKNDSDNEEDMDSDDEKENFVDATDQMDENENWLWDTLIREACQDVDFHIETVDDVFRPPFFKGFISRLRDRVQHYVDIVSVLDDDSEVYAKIYNTISRLKRRGYAEQEAEKAAWRERKYLLLELLEKYRNVIADEMIPEPINEELWACCSFIVTIYHSGGRLAPRLTSENDPSLFKPRC